MKRTTLYTLVIGIALVLIVMVSVSKKLGKNGGVGKADRASCKTLGASGVTVKNVKGEVDIQNGIVKVAHEAGRAVVAISTERTRRVGFQRPSPPRQRRSPFGNEDPFEKFFEDFFGQMPDREFRQKGLGSGFIIDKEGHILTNHHVIDGADTIKISLPDGRSFPGIVKGADPRSDLAIIKIDASDLPTIELGDSDLTLVGEWVVALGNPFGHILQSPEPTVTVGVVSALHRRIPTAGGESGFLDMIQTDAAINPGNSGGPLCDLNGKVVGINVAIFSTSGGYQGIGFAIPSNSAKVILSDLIKGIEITYGWLGVSVQEITPDMAEYFNLPDQKGALISEIIPGSAAQDAGLKEGDIVFAFDGKTMETVHSLLREVSDTKVGQRVRIGVIRDRVKQTIEVTIGKRPSRTELYGGEAFGAVEEVKEWRGIQITAITDTIANDLNLKDNDGVVIIKIDRSSTSYAAGLREGDVLKEINRTRIHNIQDYKAVTGEASGAALVRTERGYFVIK
ncbi:MAG: Do family serine endopeptidase [Candidatus Omnitrophota bacterium]